VSECHGVRITIFGLFVAHLKGEREIELWLKQKWSFICFVCFIWRSAVAWCWMRIDVGSKVEGLWCRRRAYLHFAGHWDVVVSDTAGTSGRCILLLQWTQKNCELVLHHSEGKGILKARGGGQKGRLSVWVCMEKLKPFSFVSLIRCSDLYTAL
jgi:hypothetical protein